MDLGGVFVGGLLSDTGISGKPGEQGYQSTPQGAMPTHRRAPQGLAFGPEPPVQTPSKQASKQGGAFARHTDVL